MRKEDHGILTFHSTNFAIQGEEFLKTTEVNFRTIPTPREITVSCGLAHVFPIADLDEVLSYVDQGRLDVAGVYAFRKLDGLMNMEKLR